MVSGEELQGFEPRHDVGDQRSSMSTSGSLPLLGLMPGMHPLLPTSCEVCCPGRLASASLSQCSFQLRDVLNLMPSTIKA